MASSIGTVREVVQILISYRLTIQTRFKLASVSCSMLKSYIKGASVPVFQILVLTAVPLYPISNQPLNYFLRQCSSIVLIKALSKKSAKTVM